MVAKQGYVGRAFSTLIGWLAVPRVVTLPFLLLFWISCSHVIWHYVGSVKTLAWIAGMATPFCTMCATAVWAMRDRLDDAIETEEMSSEAYQRFVSLVTIHRARSTRWSAATALMALLASSPTVSNQLIGPIWHWMMLASGGAIGFSIYAYLLANYWEQQTRTFRNRQKLDEKRRREKDDFLAEFGTSNSASSDAGWSEGPNLVTAPTHH